jgi:hypothetical protein
VEVDSTGQLLAGFFTAKPFQLFSSSTLPLAVVARLDRFKPNTDNDGYINTIITGLTWDLNKRSAISFDYQEQTPHSGAVIAATKTYFVHLLANF